jgi:2-dehydro-3-deoxygluconokinase
VTIPPEPPLSPQSRDLVVLGEAMMSLVPEHHESFRRSRHLRRLTGGAEANVAVAVSRLGHRVTWIGRVGDDLTGEGVLDDLRQEGVFLDQAIVDDSAHTGILIREIPSVAPSRVSYARRDSAGARISPADIDPAVVAAHTMAHVTGVTAALSESAREAVRFFLQTARDHNVTTVFDLNYRSRLWSPEQAGPVFRELAGMADIVTGGVDEWRLAFGVDNLTDIDLPATTTLVMTAGDAEVNARVAGEILSAPAMSAHPEDVVGAGDAFIGGVLSALLAGTDWPTALRQGTYCGARVVSSLGDWGNLPWGEKGLVTIPDSNQEVMR